MVESREHDIVDNIVVAGEHLQRASTVSVPDANGAIMRRGRKRVSPPGLKQHDRTWSVWPS